MSRNVIELERASERCGDIQVIENVSVAVPEGQIIGLVGANGVGKTTLLKLLAGFLRRMKEESVWSRERFPIC